MSCKMVGTRLLPLARALVSRACHLPRCSILSRTVDGAHLEENSGDLPLDEIADSTDLSPVDHAGR